MAMIISASLPRRRAEEKAILSTRGRPAEIPGFNARARQLPRDFAAGLHRHRQRASVRSTAPHQSHRRRGLRGLCSLHPRPQMKLLLLARPLPVMMWLDPRLCAQGRPTCRSQRRSEIGCCRHVPASSRRALALRRLALRRFILFLVQLKHMLLMYHLSLSTLCLRRVPATSLVLATQKQISETRESITDLYTCCRSNGQVVIGEVEDLHSTEQIVLEHDLMVFVDIPDHYST